MKVEEPPKRSKNVLLILGCLIFACTLIFGIYWITPSFSSVFGNSKENLKDNDKPSTSPSSPGVEISKASGSNGIKPIVTTNIPHAPSLPNPGRVTNQIQESFISDFSNQDTEKFLVTTQDIHRKVSIYSSSKNIWTKNWESLRGSPKVFSSGIMYYCESVDSYKFNICRLNILDINETPKILAKNLTKCDFNVHPLKDDIAYVNDGKIIISSEPEFDFKFTSKRMILPTFSHDGSKIYFISNKLIYFKEINSKNPPELLNSNCFPIVFMQFSYDNNWLLVKYEERAFVFNLETKAKVDLLDKKYYIRHVFFSKDNEHVYTVFTTESDTKKQFKRINFNTSPNTIEAAQAIDVDLDSVIHISLI